MPGRRDMVFSGVNIALPHDVESAVHDAFARMRRAGGSARLDVEYDTFETSWNARNPHVRQSVIEYVPRLLLECGDRARWLSLIYPDNRYGQRFVHPDAIRRVVRWVLGDVDEDTDDPRSDADVEASKQRAETE